MKLTYDPRYNIAYLRLHAKTAEVETIHVSDEINVDLAPDGTVYGIELLNANVQFAREDAGQLVLQNEATGERTEVKLPIASDARPMNAQIRLLDVVALTEDVPDRGLLRGQVGAVVESLGPDVFEVEFVDNDGRTYATLPLRASQLLVLHYQSA